MARQTRREFLENSMLAAAAAATAGASSFEMVARAAEPVSPSERLRGAVIGTDVSKSGQPSGRGQVHLNHLMRRKDLVDIVAVCDCDEFVGQKTCDRVEKDTEKRPAFVRDLRRIMDDKNIDFVTIATPNHWHSLAAIWAIQAGKDVYVEKPVSHNVSEGRRVVDAARKHQRICQAGTQCRSMTGTQAFMKFIHEGGIGDVKLARGLCYKRRRSIGDRGEYAVPESVDYDLWAGPAPMAKLTRPQFHYDWHWQWDYGNGDLGNQGIHQMDLARWALNVNDIGRGVLSYGGRLGYEDAGDTANTQVSIHDYGDKTLVFEVRGLETPRLKGANVGLIVYGTKGYGVMADYEGGKIFDLDGNELHTFISGKEAAHFDNFFDAVRSRRSQDQNGEILEGHLSSALCHLGNISYRLGEKMPVSDVEKRLAAAKPKDECLETFERVKEHLKANQIDLDAAKLQYGALLTIDSKAEKFTGAGSDKANPMLTREYRKGFEVPASADKV